MRNVLRAATTPLHQRLDGLVGSPCESVEAYVFYLEGMHELYAIYAGSWDQTSGRFGLPLSASKVLACLEADLHDSVAALTEPRIKIDSFRTQRPGTTGITQQQESRDVGVAYVLEGSALGGSFLYRSARDQRDFAGSLRFLQRLAGDAKTRWPAFRDALEQCEAQESEAVAGAIEVFQSALMIFAKPTGNERERREETE